MNTPETMTILAIEPEKPPVVKEIGTDLKSLQQEVGGYIQAVYPFEDPVAIICNEEGKLDNLPLNRALRDDEGQIYDVLAGTVLIVGLGEEDFCSLPDDLIDKYTDLYKTPEQFMMVGNKLVVLPLEEMESSKVPVYRHSAAFAMQTGERDTYRQSHHANMECKDAIEKAIADHYSNNRLDGKAAVNEVVSRFGKERVQLVLAATIQHMEWDGRISMDNKGWARSVHVPNDTDSWGNDRNLDYTLGKTHPGLIDLFVTQARKLYLQPKKEQPSIHDQLQKPSVHSAKPKKAKEPER